jgi:hypothetical protein
VASVGSSLLPASALLTTPVIVNQALALADTEYTVTLPIGTRKFSMRLRDAAVMKVATTAGDIAGNTYFTMNLGEPYNADSVTGSSTITLYVSVSKPSQTLEVWYWT